MNYCNTSLWWSVRWRFIKIHFFKFQRTVPFIALHNMTRLLQIQLLQLPFFCSTGLLY